MSAVSLRQFPPASRPATWNVHERRFALALGIAVLVLGGIVEMRSAWQQTRKTDAEVFFRAAWAIRVGAELYEVEDSHGWHYHYPPLFAIVMMPFADAPPGQARDGLLPFAVSVGIWYVLNVGFLAAGVHHLATALEEHLPTPGSTGRWWLLRVLPSAACFMAVGQSLTRGQVSLLLLALVCALTAATLRGRRFRAGIWLAAAICLKIIPAYLLLFPLWRRDARCLAGCAAGLLVGLVMVPLAVLGGPRTFHYYREIEAKVLRPGVGFASPDEAARPRTRELTGITQTDSQSFVAVLHNSYYLDRTARPLEIQPWARAGHWGLAAAMTLATLAAARLQPCSPLGEALFIGLLALAMTVICPVCHFHYFALLIPALTALLALRWRCRGGPGAGLVTLGGVVAAASLLPTLAGLEILRDLGLLLHAGLLVWAVGLAALWTDGRSRRVQGRGEGGETVRLGGGGGIVPLEAATVASGDENDGGEDEDEGQAATPGGPFVEVENREDEEDGDRDRFLENFELGSGEAEVAEPVRRHLKGVFGQGDEPAGQDGDDQGRGAKLEVAVPGEGHEDVGENQE
jgi:hypothetical protein